jgi:CubicO group peptidase (beta-lactamase class C family)
MEPAMSTHPESVGLSSERLARVDEHLRRHYVDPGKIAGCLTLVARRGELVHHSPIGRADLARDTPMAQDTLFRIYSMTKPIASVALMALYEEGHFALTDPVHRFLPAWRDLGVFVMGNHPNWITRPVERPMTVRDLLCHTSGLTYGFLESTNVDAAYRTLGIGGEKSGATLRDMAEKLAAVPLEFSPGTAWNYSVSTDMVGHLVEIISGQPLDVFLRERIFAPLGMDDTFFQVPEAKLPRFAANYARRRDRSLKLEDDPQDSPYGREVTFFSGGGGLVSTGTDYLRFCQMLLNGGELGGARILGRKTIELMTQNHLPDGRDLASCSIGLFGETPFEGQGFGLGFSVREDPVKGQVMSSRGTFAWGGAASTIFWIDPAEELIVIFMTQLMPSRTFDFRGQIERIVYPALID